MRREVAFIVTAGLVLALAAQSKAQALPPYDGTGSVNVPEAFDKPDEAAAEAAKSAADRDHERQDLAGQVAAGKVAAMVALAGKYEFGDEHNAPDAVAALGLYEKAADAGNGVGLGRLCVAYILGEGRAQDTAKGLSYCNQLTDDSPAALFAKGYTTRDGKGGPADAAAAALFVRAVNGGSGAAADQLGRDALAAGKPEAARDWFRKGVFRGSVDALDDMARLVEAGQGGPQDKAEAYWLYVNAARHGNAHAQTWVAALPATAEPLKRIVLKKGKIVMPMSVLRTDGKGAQKAVSVDPNGIFRDLQGYYPRSAFEHHISGYSAIDCYVNSANRVDACWLRREDPPGYEFGHVLENIYEGVVTVAEKDAAGLPTANRVFLMAIKWRVWGG